MSDKSFEQQVREELSDLRMKPNAAVWESVAASLRKEHKRRWVLWIIILLTGLAGAGFWYLIQKQPLKQELTNKNQPKQHRSSLEQAGPLPEKQGIIVSANAKKATAIQEQTVKASLSSNITHQANQVKRVITQQPLYQKNIVTSDEKARPVTPAVKADVQQPEKGLKSLNVVVKTNTVENAGLPLKTISAEGELVRKDTSSLIRVLEDKKDTVISFEKIEPVKPVLTDSAVTKNKPGKTNKWQWRISFSAGTSGVRNSIRSLLEQTNSRAYANAFSGNSAPVSGMPGTGSGSNMVSPVVRDAFSFASSIEVVRKMGKKEQHALGLTAGYYLYTTRTGVGSLNTGTVQFSNVNASNDENKYYGVKDSASYTSYYHFFQFGLRYYQSLKWFKKINLQWYGGIGVNALLGSNGLHLGSTSSGAYLFENRSLLRSIQMDISGGFDFGLGKTKQVYLGPQVQYMLSNLSKQPGVNQHLFRPSVRLSFLLDKRK